MKKILSIVALTTTIFAANNQDMQSEYQQYLQSQQTEFNNYKKNLEDGFKEYKASLDKEFSNYKKSLSKEWKNPELTTKTTFVEYSKDKKIRKKVDYQNNFIEIDVIAKDMSTAKKEMAKSLYSLSTETTKEAFNKNPVLSKVNKKLATDPKLSNVIKVTKPSNEPIIADMVFKTPPTPKRVVKFAIDNVKKHRVTVEKSKVPHMNVYKIRIKLPSKAFLAKAKIYKNDVFRRANQFKLTPEFIYSIIHTESSFNPMARSYVPAFGLMQLVPQTAGADAYKMLYGKKKILAPSYLYNAKNNILMGSAYLKRIYYGYMRKIKNPTSRLYCTIAAYNTGAGNVACAFNSVSKNSKGVTICKRSRGDYNIIKASSKINKMSAQEVYNHLLSNLKYDEPKHYLKRVKKRLYIYRKALSTNAL